MIIDGKKIRDEMKDELRTRFANLPTAKLGAVLVGDNVVSAKYVALKQKFGTDVGVEVLNFEYPQDITEADLMEEVARLVGRQDISGLLVQLPLPSQINTEKILDLIPPEKDVDALGPEPKVLPPVVKALEIILEKQNYSVSGKKAVVVGSGRLVGAPTAIWLIQNGASVEVATLETTPEELKEKTLQADLIVLGAGVPGLLKPDMVKEGVVILDAGTSEEAGKLVGDADPAVAAKALIFTPVPGGVGPITLAGLFSNLADLLK